MFFWKGKWQILINATLSGSAHGGRGVAELGGGGWLPVLFFFFQASFSPLFEMVSLTRSLLSFLASLHFHAIVVSALILYPCYNVSRALTSCSSLTSYGLLIIPSDFPLRPLSPLHLLSLFISRSLLSFPTFPCFCYNLPAAPFSLQFGILYSCPVSSPLLLPGRECAAAAVPLPPVAPSPPGPVPMLLVRAICQAMNNTGPRLALAC